MWIVDWVEVALPLDGAVQPERFVGARVIILNQEYLPLQTWTNCRVFFLVNRNSAIFVDAEVHEFSTRHALVLIENVSTLISQNYFKVVFVKGCENISFLLGRVVYFYLFANSTQHPQPTLFMAITETESTNHLYVLY